VTPFFFEDYKYSIDGFTVVYRISLLLMDIRYCYYYSKYKYYKYTKVGFRHEYRYIYLMKFYADMFMYF